MPTYSYKAIDAAGRSTRGQFDAPNESELEARLSGIGLALLSFHPVRTGFADFLSKKVGLQELALFCFQLEQLTRAGVPLLQGLADLHDSTVHARLRTIIATLSAEVESGKLLSEALAAYPVIFSPVFVGLVQAGEQAGKLPEILARLAAMLKWQDELAAKTQRLLLYPLFVMCTVLGAVIFLMAYLLPQMAVFLHNLGQELPLQTRALLWLSDLLVTYWAWLVGLLLILVLGTVLACKSRGLRHRIDRFKLQLPVFGNILQKIILARFASCFALMYQAGIPVLNALAACEAIVGNQTVASAVSRVYRQINTGSSMSDSFREAMLFPPLMARMISVGETTGNLDQALFNISYFYDREVSESTEKMLSLLEPALTVVLGVILGSIMLAVLGPVYDALGRMKM